MKIKRREVAGIPRRLSFDHGVENDQQFAHTGREGHLGFFPLRNEALVKGFDDGIMPGRGQGGHVERRPDLRATAPNSSSPLPGAAVSG